MNEKIKSPQEEPKKKEIYVDPKNEEYGHNLPFWRDNKKLWELNIPSEKMNTSELMWILDMPFWEDEEGNIVITPNEVLKDPDKYPAHKDKLAQCDTSFPLDIMKNKKGDWLTLDGLHRLVRLITDGEKTVMVRKIPPEIIHLTARDEE